LAWLQRKTKPCISHAIYDDEDLARRNTIANLLADWGLIELVNPKLSEENQAPMKFIKVIPHKEKHEWELISKYKIGKKF